MIVYVFFFCFIGFFVSGFLKGWFHYKYLKEVYSIKNEYNFLSSFSFENYSMKNQFLMLPYFIRKRELENETTKILIFRIYFCLFLSVVFFIGLFIIPFFKT
jgi:hypothetical protein